MPVQENDLHSFCTQVLSHSEDETLEALALARLYHARYPRHLGFALELADVLVALERPDLALQALADPPRADPGGSGQAKLFSARVYLESGRPAAALVTLAALEPAEREALRAQLREIGDVERILARVALQSAKPRDLAALRDALGVLPALQRLLAGLDTPLLEEARAGLRLRADLHGLLERALVPSPPYLLRDGGVIASGYDAELDESRSISTDTDTWLLRLELAERERTGIAGLKVGYNRVQGYFIEVQRSQAERVPPDYHRRQTVKSAERFITPELKQFEDKVLGARERALLREKQLYEGLLERLTGELADLQRIAGAITLVDVLANLAERAVELDYVRPQRVDEPRLAIEAGRHPVVERMLDSPFVPNDLALDDGRRMLVITGPNMGGKSTYMRQAALIVVMAGMGSFCTLPSSSRSIVYCETTVLCSLLQALAPLMLNSAANPSSALDIRYLLCSAVSLSMKAWASYLPVPPPTRLASPRWTTASPSKVSWLWLR